ncbi:hypothetical protein BRADI_3g43965v3 [Brachypodium distachyon]|uniref:Uncharacterized protein n=1 Tax=Brachypodium distachyon TaxID=15368 RepID=A0A2K2D314_BRADI|nr:hypothetical protein BRADI_3g43965v3 [Brachypodium distachyon]
MQCILYFCLIDERRLLEVCSFMEKQASQFMLECQAVRQLSVPGSVPSRAIS